MAKMKQGDDPKDFKVDEVNDYLAGADEAERARVLDAEASGKNRSTVSGASSDTSGDGDATGATAFTGETPVDVVEHGENDDGTPIDEKGKGVDEPPIETQQKAMEDAAREQLADVRGVSADEESDDSSSGGPRGATAGNQQPVTVTGKDLKGRIPKGATVKVTPLVPVNGGDGTRVSAATKNTDNIWTPFKPNASVSNGATVAAAQSTASNGQKAATIAANALTKF